MLRAGFCFLCLDGARPHPNEAGLAMLRACPRDDTVTKWFHLSLVFLRSKVGLRLTFTVMAGPSGKDDYVWLPPLGTPLGPWLTLVELADGLDRSLAWAATHWEIDPAVVGWDDPFPPMQLAAKRVPGPGHRVCRPAKAGGLGTQASCCRDRHGP